MSSTSASLLIRVRDLLDEQAWNRLVELYSPLLFEWGIRRGLPTADAADLVQDVFVVLARELPQFQYEPSRSFRAWLKTITDRRAKNFHRDAAKRPSPGLDADAGQQPIVGSEAELQEEQEYRAFVTQRILEIVRREFRDDDWMAFQKQVFEDQPASQVASSLGISINRVYIAKSRVLRRVREEAQGLLD